MKTTDGDLFHEICESFGEKFQQLVGEHISMAPEHLRDELQMAIQDKCSAYHCGVSDYIVPISPLHQAIYDYYKP